ncbi:MAG: LysE family transporter [Sulfurospirillaceae bacterium]|nr:LysE family transporter [Sulfurospirillaceae bacterium]
MVSLIQGFLISIGLIVAIGAQNVYLLKKGLLKDSVFMIASICFAIDALLITAGVKGIGTFLKKFPSFVDYITYFGIVFLVIYGLLSIRSIFKDQTIHMSQAIQTNTKLSTILTTLSLSLLNPHVYLDTLLLIGSIGGHYKGVHQNLFILGAISASFTWFYALGYGSRILIPLFKKPFTWKLLDAISAFIMFFVAYSFFRTL